VEKEVTEDRNCSYGSHKKISWLILDIKITRELKRVEYEAWAATDAHTMLRV
jgi:hypothetical protein